MPKVRRKRRWYNDSITPARSTSIASGLVFMTVPQADRMQLDIVSGQRAATSSSGPRLAVHPILGMAATNPTGYDISMSYDWPSGATTAEYTLAMIVADPLGVGGGRVFDADMGGSGRVFQFNDEPRFIAFDTSANNSQAFPSTALTTEQRRNGYSAMARIGADKVPTVSVESAANRGGTGGANDQLTIYTATALPNPVKPLGGSANFGILNEANGALKWHGQAFLFAMWNRKLDDSEAKVWHSDPYILLKYAGTLSSYSPRRNSGGGARSWGSVIS